jgi:hypothetical protein
VIWNRCYNLVTIHISVFFTHYKEEKEEKYDGKKEKIKEKPKTAKIGSGTVQFMITNRMRRNLENELNYLAEEIDVMDPQIASVVIERGLSRPSSGMPKSWIKIQQEIPFLEKQMTRLKNSVLKLAGFIIYKIAPVAITAYTIGYILPNFVRLIVNKSTGLIKGNKPLKSSSKGDISKNSKSSTWKGIGTKRKSNEGSKIQNVDIKSMSKIFGR